MGLGIHVHQRLALKQPTRRSWFSARAHVADMGIPHGPWAHARSARLSPHPPRKGPDYQGLAFGRSMTACCIITVYLRGTHCSVDITMASRFYTRQNERAHLRCHNSCTAAIYARLMRPRSRSRYSIGYGIVVSTAKHFPIHTGVARSPVLHGSTSSSPYFNLG